MSCALLDFFRFCYADFFLRDLDAPYVVSLRFGWYCFLFFSFLCSFRAVFFKVGLCFYPPFVTCCTSRSTDRRRIDCFCCTCCHLFKFFQPCPLLHRPHLIAALFPSPRCFGQFSHSMTRFGNFCAIFPPANQRAAAPAGTINRTCIPCLPKTRSSIIQIDRMR